MDELVDDGTILTFGAMEFLAVHWTEVGVTSRVGYNKERSILWADSDHHEADQQYDGLYFRHEVDYELDENQRVPHGNQTFGRSGTLATVAGDQP